MELDIVRIYCGIYSLELPLNIVNTLSRVCTVLYDELAWTVRYHYKSFIANGRRFANLCIDRALGTLANSNRVICTPLSILYNNNMWGVWLSEHNFTGLDYSDNSDSESYDLYEHGVYREIDYVKDQDAPPVSRRRYRTPEEAKRTQYYWYPSDPDSDEEHEKYCICRKCDKWDDYCSDGRVQHYGNDLGHTAKIHLSYIIDKVESLRSHVHSHVQLYRAFTCGMYNDPDSNGKYHHIMSIPTMTLFARLPIECRITFYTKYRHYWREYAASDYTQIGNEHALVVDLTWVRSLRNMFGCNGGAAYPKRRLFTYFTIMLRGNESIPSEMIPEQILDEYFTNIIFNIRTATSSHAKYSETPII
jgi:hypothetical protein